MVIVLKKDITETEKKVLKDFLTEKNLKIVFMMESGI